MKILCVGNVYNDFIMQVSSFPIENIETKINNKIECIGGAASNAAYLLGKWDSDVYFAGVVGNDEFGKKIKDDFEMVNVNTDYLKISNEKSNTNFKIGNQENKKITILTFNPQNNKLDDFELEFEPDILLFDGGEYDFSKNLIEKYPSAISIISAETYSENTISLAKKVDYIVCSKKVAEELSNIKIDYNNNVTLEKLYKTIKNIFHGMIIVTLEEKGCLYEIDNNIKQMASIKVDVVDSTYAGDIFCGAFTYGISKQMDFEQILKLSNITAGLSVSRIGSRHSIFSLEEIREYYHELK